MGASEISGPPRSAKGGMRSFTLKRLRQDRGATLIEFALIMVPFFVILFGILEVGLIFWGSFELDNATQDTARMIRTGQVASGNMSKSSFAEAVCGRVSLLGKDCTSKLRVDVRSYDNFSQMSPPDALDGAGELKEPASDDFAYDPGGARDVVLVTTFYEWPLINFMTEFSLANMANGNRLLRASAAFRNEPFPEPEAQ